MQPSFAPTANENCLNGKKVFNNFLSIVPIYTLYICDSLVEYWIHFRWRVCRRAMNVFMLFSMRTPNTQHFTYTCDYNTIIMCIPYFCVAFSLSLFFSSFLCYVQFFFTLTLLIYLFSVTSPLYLLSWLYFSFHSL